MNHVESLKQLAQKSDTMMKHAAVFLIRGRVVGMSSNVSYRHAEARVLNKKRWSCLQEKAK
jgi:hypothetical protein